MRSAAADFDVARVDLKVNKGKEGSVVGRGDVLRGQGRISPVPANGRKYSEGPRTDKPPGGRQVTGGGEVVGGKFEKASRTSSSDGTRKRSRRSGHDGCAGETVLRFIGRIHNISPSIAFGSDLGLHPRSWGGDVMSSSSLGGF